LCLIVIVILFGKVSSLGTEVRDLNQRNDRAFATLQDSLKRAQAELAATKDLAPGLGEYMTTIQLHAGKLWFATKASNWELAEYELDELKETMEAGKGVNAEKHEV